MSITIRTHLVLGIAIPRPLLLVPPVRGCNHALDTSRFCGECGAPMWIQNEYEVVDVEEFGLEIFQDNTANFIDVDDDRPVILGRLVDATGGLDPIAPLDPAAMPAVMADLRRAIAGLNLPINPATLQPRLFVARYVA